MISAPTIFKELPFAVQTEMVHRDQRGQALNWDLPLVGINGATKDLGRRFSQEMTIQLLQSGALRGFDIRCEEDGRPTYRVLSRSLEIFRESGGRKSLEIGPENWPDIWRMVFGRAAANQTLKGTQVKLALNCTRQHVMNLAPHFKLVEEGSQGRGNTPSFTTASVEAWLKGRML
jgi:hypothetical protein